MLGETAPAAALHGETGDPELTADDLQEADRQLASPLGMSEP